MKRVKIAILLTALTLGIANHLIAATVTGDALTIGTSGGSSHSLGGTASSITAGDQNKVNADNAFIGGGQQNTNTGARSVIGGGYINNSDDESVASFIGGGAAN